MENLESRSEDILGLNQKQREHIKKALIWMDCLMMLGISLMIILD